MVADVFNIDLETDPTVNLAYYSTLAHSIRMAKGRLWSLGTGNYILDAPDGLNEENLPQFIQYRDLKLEDLDDWYYGGTIAEYECEI